MPTATSVTCPNCGTDLELTDALAAPLLAEAERRHAREKQALQAQAAEAAAAAAAERVKLDAEKLAMDGEIERRVQAKAGGQREAVRVELAAEQEERLKGSAERERLATEARRAADAELEELKLQARRDELDRAAARRLEQQAEAGRLEAAKREERSQVEEAFRLRLAEANAKATKAAEAAADMQRKLEQGSQQSQGEILELELKAELARAFPWDELADVKQGARGGDLLHRIQTPAGRAATIMWEIKRTKAWGGDWCAKAKEDAAEARAEFVVIVSDVMPPGGAVDGIGRHEDVWVCAPAFAVRVARLLRAHAEGVALVRRSHEGKQEKAERLYDYMVGPEFRARMQAVAAPFIEMQKELDREKRAATLAFQRREKQIDSILHSFASLQGDMQGIGGSEVAQLPEFAAE